MYCIVLLFLDIPKTLGCSGGGAPAPAPKKVPDDPFEGLNLTGKKGDAVERNLGEGYGGFNIPHNVEQSWRYWLQQYELSLKEEEEMAGGAAGAGGGAAGGGAGDETIDRSPASGWPERWNGLGGGHGGAPAPPWAYVPIDSDLPAYCYLTPKKGTCDQTLTRYGYNPITQKCEEFIYSGCGENQNNFVKKESCDVACMAMPIAGCEFDTQQYIEDD